MSTIRDTNYWKLQKEVLLSQLHTSENGLKDEEVVRRLEEYGLNEIPTIGHRTSLSIFLSQFKNPLVYVLIFASALSGFLGEITEAIIIIIIMLVNALLGFTLEHKSERAVEELRKYLSYDATVVRNGKKTTVDARKIVAGDIVHLAIGDVVPADIRLFGVDDFQTNESVLTGESTPIDKTTAPVEIDKPLPHQLSNIALMGSTVTNGSGRGVVVATGKNSYFGHIATKLGLLPPKTDFQKNIASFGNFLVKMILVLTVFVFLVNSILGHGVLDSLIFALALAVGIIPEALPVIISVGLSGGALRLVKKHVVVKRLEAIEDIGNVDVLCTDKTGTLTQNKVVAQSVVDIKGNFDLDLLKFALLCNTAMVEGDRILGNPIDVAIWNFARAQGFNEQSLTDFKLIHEIPFGYNRRRMSVVVSIGKRQLLISKGAPEAILDVSVSIGNESMTQTMTEAKIGVSSLIEGYRQAGNRLIALAYKEIEEKSVYSVKDEGNLTFVGLIVLSDPPKEDAVPAISRLKSLGMKLKILSGDDPVVTANVCRRLGIDTGGQIITGMDIEKMEDSELQKVAELNDVYGRVSPEQKFAIVGALKKSGHVTGFLGDGVNDAPALKLADVGISVDSGVQVAKEASSIILLKKNLSVIADGVAEGRKAFGNMIKYIMNTISANLGNMLTLAAASLFLPFIPLLPSQILLTNLLSDAPLIAISTDNLDDEDLRKPKRWNIRPIAKFALFFGLISSIFDFITISSLVYLLNAGPELFRTGWFVESVMSEILVTFSIRTRRRFYKSKPSNMLIATSIAVALIALIFVYSPFGLFFEFVQPPLWFLGLIFGILACYFLIVEGLKHLFFNRYTT
jgi:Mg2+-importing ATPase